ncbi:DUF4230 domain-containing protein [Litoribacter populi]|uniref:DUF4230 domain-containing protein n=1 Tax=Litoribacter populi TaxID=2598460 RepID=UPI00117FA47E|nr:DUF4230 domain-containing protein [Litoribacter populi]
MIRFLLGIVVTLIIGFGVLFFINKNEKQEQTEINSSMIQEQIKNVGKLIVVEGHYSQVMDYKNTRQNFFRIFPANKKVLVVVNAKVTVEYDLSKLQTQVDEENRIVYLDYIPEANIHIYPDLEYYDVTQDYWNPLKADDLNKIRRAVDDVINEKIDKSDLKKRAHQNLISELQKIYILTNSMGWTLVYDQQPVESEDMLMNIRLR